MARQHRSTNGCYDQKHDGLGSGNAENPIHAARGVGALPPTLPCRWWRIRRVKFLRSHIPCSSIYKTYLVFAPSRPVLYIKEAHIADYNLSDLSNYGNTLRETEFPEHHPASQDTAASVCVSVTCPLGHSRSIRIQLHTPTPTYRHIQGRGHVWHVEVRPRDRRGPEPAPGLRPHHSTIKPAPGMQPLSREEGMSIYMRVMCPTSPDIALSVCLHRSVCSIDAQEESNCTKVPIPSQHNASHWPLEPPSITLYRSRSYRE